MDSHILDIKREKKKLVSINDRDVHLEVKIRNNTFYFRL